MINNMRVIGLTGGTGAGKGEVSLCFMSHGIKSLDTDKVSREVCLPGKPCLNELVEYFGEGILLSDGKLDRRGLAELVFGEEDPEKREVKKNALNRITHRHIIDAINAWLTEREKAGDALAVVDAPQLFESGFDRHCDYIVGVIADEKVRIRRIISRDSISEETAEKRIRSQKSDQFFMDSCDFIVYNNSGIDALEGQVEHILEKINYFA
ncbi:MAG: dephospho-CoA kinase [Clostridia bacterium]|nr:dephospho-CoA kinase [Clostridia bacterium]